MRIPIYRDSAALVHYQFRMVSSKTPSLIALAICSIPPSGTMTGSASGSAGMPTRAQGSILCAPWKPSSSAAETKGHDATNKGSNPCLSRPEPGFRIHFPPAVRWYGAGGEGDGTIVAGK